MFYIQYVISLRVYWDLSMFLSFSDVETCIRQLSSLQIRFIHPCKACVYLLWGIKAWSSILITSAQRVHCGLSALTRRNLIIVWCPPVPGVVQAVVPHCCFLPGVALSASLCTHSLMETFMTFLWVHRSILKILCTHTKYTHSVMKTSIYISLSTPPQRSVLKILDASDILKSNTCFSSRRDGFCFPS